MLNYFWNSVSDASSMKTTNFTFQRWCLRKSTLEIHFYYIYGISTFLKNSVKPPFEFQATREVIKVVYIHCVYYNTRYSGELLHKLTWLVHQHKWLLWPLPPDVRNICRECFQAELSPVHWWERNKCSSHPYSSTLTAHKHKEPLTHNSVVSTITSFILNNNLLSACV